MRYECKWKKVIDCGWNDHNCGHMPPLNRRKRKRRGRGQMGLEEPGPDDKVKLMRRLVMPRTTTHGSIVVFE